ncbi:cytochrome b/b6 domain-containing protein [Shewanella donghaensis]|uniref:cytochrome b/b6 domain-containing protein n=1 Tax=Shewanella donghaensis TaxID=238836 RepID=UPI001181E187|nr:cytochrome b/b6 domain-containing protein [Shewanella donghaensis]
MSIEQIKIKVWDIPTRLFHWLTVILLFSLWWTADAGEMEWHQVCAYSFLGLIIFRLLWGFIGSDTAKFSGFVAGPNKVAKYLTGKVKEPVVGHNPMGGYMVMLMLMVLVLQLITGLFASDDIFTEGPLYSMVSSDTASFLTWLHKTNFNIILGCIVLHLSAITLYAIKGNNLVGAMISGRKTLTKDEYQRLSSEPKIRSPLIALVVIGLIGSGIWVWLIAPIVEFM